VSRLLEPAVTSGSWDDSPNRLKESRWSGAS